MKQLKYIIGVLTFLFLFNSCDLLDDSPCGPKTTKDLYLLGSAVVDKNYLHNYMEGSNRVFQWSELVEHVCTDEHIKAEFRIALLDDSTASRLNLKARARISYQFLYERSVELKFDGSNQSLIGTLEVGLKHAFPDLNGWFTPSIEVYFPTKGSLAADEKFLFPYVRDDFDTTKLILNSEIIAVQIMSKYREFK